MSDSCDPMDWSWSLPGSSVHVILQARILEWVAISYFRGSSQLRDQTQVSCTAGRFFTNWTIREAHIHINYRSLPPILFFTPERQILKTYFVLWCETVVWRVAKAWCTIFLEALFHALPYRLANSSCSLWLSEAWCGQAEKERMSGMEKFLPGQSTRNLVLASPGLTRGQMLHCSFIEVQFVFQTHDRGTFDSPSGMWKHSAFLL